MHRIINLKRFKIQLSQDDCDRNANHKTTSISGTDSTVASQQFEPNVRFYKNLVKVFSCKKNGINYSVTNTLIIDDEYGKFIKYKENTIIVRGLEGNDGDITMCQARLFFPKVHF